MTNFDTFCESIGLRHGPAAKSYKQAKTEDDLCFAAGERLCLHVVAVMRALPVPRHGSVVLRILRRFGRERWLHYWSLNNAVFCEAAILDLCTVRDLFAQAKRWPELSPLIDRILVMACVYLQGVIQMDAEERALLQREAVAALDRFYSAPQASPTDCIDRIMKLPGFDKHKIRKADFLRYTVMQTSRLEPLFLMSEYDRITNA